MKALLLAALLLFVNSLVAQTSTISAENATVEKQIEANNQAVLRAIRSQDFPALKKLWSSQMIVNNPANEIFTRDDVIAAMQHGGLNYSSLKGTSEAFRVFGDIAVEMGHEDFVMATGPAAGKPLQRRYTDVWQRDGDHWVQIARQATILNVDAAWVYGADLSPSKAPVH